MVEVEYGGGGIWWRWNIVEVEAGFMFCYILPNSANGLGGV